MQKNVVDFYKKQFLEIHDMTNKGTHRRHAVILTKQCRARHIIGNQEFVSVSSHRQYLSKIGNQVKVVGETEDGICEVIEVPSYNQFMMGFQGHIEMQTEEPIIRVFDVFIKSAKSGAIYEKNDFLDA